MPPWSSRKFAYYMWKGTRDQSFRLSVISSATLIYGWAVHLRNLRELYPSCMPTSRRVNGEAWWGGLVPGLQRGAARPRAGGGEGDGDVTATAKWRQMGVRLRSVHEALGIYTHDVCMCTAAGVVL